MIEIPELGDDHHATWESLMLLAERSTTPWTLIGAHMVALHAWAAGRESVRRTRDADVLVNVRTVASATADLSRLLTEMEFELEEPSMLGQGFRFERAGVAIDVLAPDGGPRASLKTIGAAQTISVPGGTQALNRTGPVNVESRNRRGFVLLPDLLGALLVTVLAIEVDDAPEDKRVDAALLLSLVDDPEVLVAAIRPTERRWLQRHPYFADPSADVWEGFQSPGVASSVFSRLAQLDDGEVGRRR